MKVSESGFYAWRTRPEAERVSKDIALATHIRAIHTRSRRTYGRPRIHAELQSIGLKVAQKRVARLMRSMGLFGRMKRKFKATTDSAHRLPVAENLIQRRFEEASKPNQIWCSDITYVWTWQGWMYLATILDAFSRRVVGWALADNMRTDLATKALKMALARRIFTGQLVHHSDRGSQYASHEYRQMLQLHGIKISMSRRGNCWDNAIAESFFATLKKELIYRKSWVTKQQLSSEVDEWIDFYNRTRRHSSIGYCSPIDYECLTREAAVA